MTDSTASQFRPAGRSMLGRAFNVVVALGAADIAYGMALEVPKHPFFQNLPPHLGQLDGSAYVASAIVMVGVVGRCLYNAFAPK